MGKREYEEDQKIKRVVYFFTIALFISFFLFIALFSAYNKKLKEDSREALTELGKESRILDNDELDETKQVSYSSDLSVLDNSNNINSNNSSKNNNSSKSNATKNNMDNINSKTIDNKISSNNLNINENSDTENQNNNSNNTDNNLESNNLNTENSLETINSNTVDNNLQNTNTAENNNLAVETQNLSFIAPVSGEIIKDFAGDTLVFSNTLREWTTHYGIDIKGEKTSVVVASEAGVVESIKNDPRYGLTITIEHENGFKTIYSNLLTTEFVKENEMVEKGQTIATIGESASFEVADEPHLHFEIYKDGENVNPTIYLKDL